MTGQRPVAKGILVLIPAELALPDFLRQNQISLLPAENGTDNMKHLLIIFALFIAAVCPSAYAQSSTSIRNSIFSQIESAGLRGWDISVDARYGKVTLDGSVASEKDRQTVESIAAKTSGVERLENNLRVTGSNPYSNSALEQAIRSELMARPDLRNFNIEVQESQGKVVLSGLTQTQGEAQIAEQVARSHQGVTKVDNQISVRPGPGNSELALRVRRALLGEGDIKLDSLEISANNGTVTLRGDRTDFRDIDRILSVAMMVEGVKNVNNQLTIGQQRYMQAPGTAR